MKFFAGKRAPELAKRMLSEAGERPPPSPFGFDLSQ